MFLGTHNVQIIEFIRDGASVAELQDTGRKMLGHRQVQGGCVHARKPECMGRVRGHLAAFVLMCAAV